jgi:tetratricopeptide (TPR) repeat protein
MARSGDYAGAIALLGVLQGRTPRDPRVAAMLGSCHAELGRHDESVRAFRQAVDAEPTNPEFRSALAHALRRAGRYAESLDETERLLYRVPGDRAALRLRAGVLMDAGRWEDARAALESLQAGVSSADPAEDRAALAVLAARLAPDHAEPGPAIERLEPFAADPACPAPLRGLVHWHLGRLHDGLGDTGRAFAAYAAGKRLGRTAWDPDEHARRVDALIRRWTAGDPPAAAGRDGSRLIFIVGMMRSGTSLTEQMLAQLPGVVPGGEMNAVQRQLVAFEPAAPPPHRRQALTGSHDAGAVEAMAREAWGAYDRVSPDARVTDKQPENYFHVPLIARMFPGCRFVHCRRDPMDTCLSNFFQSYTRHHPHTHDLEWLGRYQRDYQRLMEAWSSLPWIDMIDLDYEDLIADARTHLGRVAAFLGLGWDDAALRFHDSERIVRTSSRDQVRRPLSDASVRRHERYAAHLGPLRRGLGLE